ncbi:MAG: three-Cys-motif partner protein TcmP [Bacteroidota bacterium]
MSVNHLAQFNDDGFEITAAEPWFKQKVQIIQEYITAFVTNLNRVPRQALPGNGKIDEIVFVDLFSGSGLYSLGARRDIFMGTPLMVLAQDLPIHRFVFCEQDTAQLKALKIRVNKYFREKNVMLMEGKPEELIEKLKLYIPTDRKDYKVAVFCVCDPFSLDISFDTIERLSQMGFSFLIPFTFALNKDLDYKFYLQQEKGKVKKYLGGYKDMDHLEKGVQTNLQFYERLVSIYENNLRTAGLMSTTSMHKIDSGLMELPTYYIGFFSRNVSNKTMQRDVEPHTRGNLKFLTNKR